MELLRGMLALDPAARITAAEALSHRWFTEAPLPVDPRLLPTLPSAAAGGDGAALRGPPSPPLAAGAGAGDGATGGGLPALARDDLLASLGNRGAGGAGAAAAGGRR